MTPKLCDFENKENINIKEEIVDGKKFYIVSYFFLDSELWKDPINVEARGITFDEEGNIVSRPFEKFWNLNENQFTQFKDLDFTNAYYYEKLDGSMITPVVVNGKVYYKTNKSFYSEVAQSCQKDFGDNEKYNDFIREVMEEDCTPIFEYTSPMNRIVVDYGDKSKLTLLAIRFNDTGKYVFRHAVETYAKNYDIPLVKLYDNISIQSILSEDIDNREGYVIRLQSGQRVKVKFPSYLLKHRTLDSKFQFYLLKHRMTERNIAAMVIEECIDDFKALVDSRYLPMIEKIESDVYHELISIHSHVIELCYHWKYNNMSLSDIGKAYSYDPYFNCAIIVHKGRDIDEMVKKHYTSKVLPNLNNVQLWRKNEQKD